MRRVVARFEDAADASAAEADLREHDMDPSRPNIDNPFFDPSARPPEARGLLWGGLIGGILGAVVLLAMAFDVIWLPRLSPILAAGRLILVLFGFGIGVAVGGFVGGVWGTLRDIPEPAGPRVAVEVPEHRVGNAKKQLRSHDATVVDDAATRHGKRQS